jgi:hypothetical protein
MARLTWILRFLRNMIVFLTPWILRGVRASAWMIGMTFAAFWIGAPNAVRRISYQMTDRSVMAGMVEPYVTILYYALCVVVSLMIIGCWIFTSFVTVWLLGLVF